MPGLLAVYDVFPIRSSCAASAFIYNEDMDNLAEQIPGGGSPEEEIQELERKLEEKKRVLAESRGGEPQEKEALREVLREHIEEVRQREGEPIVGEQAGPGAIPAGGVGAAKKTDGDQTQQERNAHIRALIELALKKTIQDAVRAAEATTPYLLDELHDHLVDDYYDKLVALRKLRQL